MLAEPADASMPKRRGRPARVKTDDAVDTSEIVEIAETVETVETPIRTVVIPKRRVRAVRVAKTE
jgi:hypothetical protein